MRTSLLLRLIRRVLRQRLTLVCVFAAPILIILLKPKPNYNTNPSGAQIYPSLGPNLLHHFSAGQPNDKETVDFFLNVRKLSLWAVHELNRAIVKKNIYNETQLWWCDPTKTVDLRSGPFKGAVLHDIVFLADPGHVPFSVKIFQRNVTTLEEEELEIIGGFTRLAPLGGVAAEAEEPPVQLHQTHDEYFKVGKEKTIQSPQL